MMLDEAIGIVLSPARKAPAPKLIDCHECGGAGCYDCVDTDTSRPTECERCRGSGHEECIACALVPAVAVALVRSDVMPRTDAEGCPLCLRCFVDLHATGDVIRVLEGAEAMEINAQK
jgi:hypothetical protein